MRKLLLSLCLASSFSAVATQQPQNIIMVVADGMGPAYTSGYRYFSDDPATEVIERTIFDKYTIGSSTTYPAAVSGYVTDSAAGATALSTGHKSYNGAIAVDVNKQPLETVLERAKRLGYKTGSVVTSQVNHATPAAYISHNESRNNYDAIADSYLDEKINGQLKYDVLLGGGWRYFIRKDRNLVNELKGLGAQYIDSYEQLTKLTNDSVAVGLFADKGLPFAIDDSNRHRLSMMTETATKLLENDQGYFLLIEASQVDWAGHGNLIAEAMTEMDDLAKTMEYLESYVAKHPNTTVILTADHSTGGLTLAAKGKYIWDPKVLRLQQHSTETIAKRVLKTELSTAFINELFNFTLTEEEYESIVNAKADANQQLANYNALTSEQQKATRKPYLERIVGKAISGVLDSRSNTGWTSGGHTAIDVPIIAFGQHASLFKGNQNNIDIGNKIFGLLENK
ncbi:alkaline phosphatase [Colwellia sp. MEBiC06753]